MRTQNLLGLDLANLDLRTGRVLVYDSKGDRGREVKLGRLTLQAVAAIWALAGRSWWPVAGRGWDGVAGAS